MSEELFVEIGVLVVNTVVVIITGVWKLGSVRDELKDVMDEHRRDLDNEINNTRNQFAETVSALREKLIQVELYIRDTYVQKDTFNIVLERLLGEVKTLGDRMEARFVRIEAELKTRDLERSQALLQPILPRSSST